MFDFVLQGGVALACASVSNDLRERGSQAMASLKIASICRQRSWFLFTRGDEVSTEQ